MINRTFSFSFALISAMLAGCDQPALEADGETIGARYQADFGQEADIPYSEEQGDLALNESTAPEHLRASSAMYADIAYGPHRRNRLDLLLPRGDSPTGLVIFFHGGGFTAGDKSLAYERENWQAISAELLGRSVAFASVNYRYSTGPDADGAASSLDDARRAVQYLRYHSEQLRLDPERVVVAGTSAGGGAALYVGLSDDGMRDDPQDPIAGESTRVRGVYAFATQAGYDFDNWSEEVFPYRPEAAYAQVSLNRVLRKFAADTRYGKSKSGDSDEQNLAKLDLLDMMSVDDPELYLGAVGEDEIPRNLADLLHHPAHIAALARKAREAGIEVRTHAPTVGIYDTRGLTPVEWLARKAS